MVSQTSETQGELCALFARADERALAASGVGCLERCLPLLGDGAPAAVLRPLWTGLTDGTAHWAERLAETRDALKAAPDDGPRPAAAGAVRRMLDTAPAQWALDPLRTWAEESARAALAVHRDYEPPGVDAAGPLVAGELRRQMRVLEILVVQADGAGLRQVLHVSTEGRRVLAAAISRQARGTGA
ncbi:hypothetical protein ACH41E_11925 [Streptomyces sp. NPDC020412]|uniref:hypothetical protein n=1 Tax=Streptomyces sp. NPDC020412 TaxID=3365073 RepID=UPI0037A47FC8